jgi:exosortase
MEPLQSSSMNTQTADLSPSESFSAEMRAAWRQLPEKPLFFSLLAAWLALFHFMGNSTLGYINTHSLLVWMYDAYQKSGIEGEDGHGMLVPFVVLGLLWWKKNEFFALKHRVWWPGLLIVGFALVLHMLGYMVMQTRISIVALFVGIYGLIGLVWGWRWLWECRFPYFLFCFMVPLGSFTEKATFHLRLFVSWVVEHMFSDVFLINVMREGTQLFGVHDGQRFQFEVAAACSGIRSLVSIFLIATVYGFVVFKSPMKRFIMMAAGIPLAVIGNIVRLALIVAAGHLGGQSWGNFVHEDAFFSLIPYIPAIMGVMYIGRWLESKPDVAPAKAGGTTTGATTTTDEAPKSAADKS